MVSCVGAIRDGTFRYKRPTRRAPTAATTTLAHAPDETPFAATRPTQLNSRICVRR